MKVSSCNEIPQIGPELLEAKSYRNGKLFLCGGYGNWVIFTHGVSAMEVRVYAVHCR
jgi:hypothetical protein